MKMVSFSQVNKDPELFFDSLVVNDECVGIHLSDCDDVVVMSKGHYDGLIETLYLFKEPANEAHLGGAIAQYRASKVLK
jgi:antitoxin YefM